MSNDDVIKNFLNAADKWICDDYSLDVRCLAYFDGNEFRLWSALIQLSPLQAKEDFSFKIDGENFFIVQHQNFPVKKSEIFFNTKKCSRWLYLFWRKAA